MKRGTKGRTGASGSIRIISGRWRGRKLPVLNSEGLRPTTDRTKETLFNWLMQDIRDARVLDVFAGSGGLGIEALSRYASEAVFVERDSKVAANLADNLKLLGCDDKAAKVINSDAHQALTAMNSTFDVIFIDPPFNKGIIPGIITLLQAHQLVSDGGLVYIESEVAHSNYEVPEAWSLRREKATRQLVYRLYEYQKE